MLKGATPRSHEELAQIVKQMIIAGELNGNQQAYIIGSVVAPVVQHEKAMVKRRKQTIRQKAYQVRNDVISGCNEVRKCCGFACGPIMEVHHIQAVSNGGGSHLSNLIGLCPNCHTVVGKIQDATANQSQLDALFAWILKAYPDRTAKNLTAISSKCLSWAEWYEVTNNV